MRIGQQYAIELFPTDAPEFALRRLCAQASEHSPEVWQAMADEEALRSLELARQHDVLPVDKWPLPWQGLHRPAPHDDHLPLCQGAEMLHVLGQVHEQLTAIPNAAAFVDAGNHAERPGIGKLGGR